MAFGLQISVLKVHGLRDEDVAGNTVVIETKRCIQYNQYSCITTERNLPC